MRETRRRGVTPAIATMILLTATLVLSLIVGAYTSSLFRPNVNQVQLVSALLYDGETSDNASSTASASLTIILKNPDLATNISSLKLTSSALMSPIESWSLTPGPQPDNGLLIGGHNIVVGGSTTSFVLYPIESPPIDLSVGGTYQYYVQLANGQSISGALIAQ